MSLQVANTIIQQINAICPTAFMCYGASRFLGSDNLEDSRFYRKENCLGYMQFTAQNNPKYPQHVQVKIVLDWSDTYIISVWKRDRFGKIEVYEERKEVYCDMLVSVLDDILG